MVHGGAFILLIAKDTGRILMGKRGMKTKFNPGTWCPFGGTMEEGESPLDTAERELEEETQITPDSYVIRRVPVYIMRTENCPDGNTHTMHIYAAVTDHEVPAQIDGESLAWEWCDAGGMAARNLHPVVPKLMSDDTATGNISRFVDRACVPAEFIISGPGDSSETLGSRQKRYSTDQVHSICAGASKSGLSDDGSPDGMNEYAKSWISRFADKFRAEWIAVNGGRTVRG